MLRYIPQKLVFLSLLIIDSTLFQEDELKIGFYLKSNKG